MVPRGSLTQSRREGQAPPHPAARGAAQGTLSFLGCSAQLLLFHLSPTSTPAIFCRAAPSPPISPAGLGLGLALPLAALAGVRTEVS